MSVKISIDHHRLPSFEIIHDFIDLLCKTQSLSTVFLRVSGLREMWDGDDASDEFIRRLSNLKDLHHLTQLSLNLEKNYITSSANAATHLAKLSQCKRLTYLNIDLFENRIGVLGARSLADFRLCEHLTDLRVGLCCCDIGDDGVLSLTELCYTPNLRTLVLRLQCNDISDLGMQHLTRFKESSTIQKLVLDLGGNAEISEDGLLLLCVLHAIPALKQLKLGFGTKKISSQTKEMLQATTAFGDQATFDCRVLSK
jgi:Ran GTPase-activating protein (RanGAP) involved in mRNA processing and transport